MLLLCQSHEVCEEIEGGREGRSEEEVEGGRSKGVNTQMKAESNKTSTRHKTQDTRNKLNAVVQVCLFCRDCHCYISLFSKRHKDIKKRREGEVQCLHTPGFFVLVTFLGVLGVRLTPYTPRAFGFDSCCSAHAPVATPGTPDPLSEFSGGGSSLDRLPWPWRTGLGGRVLAPVLMARGVTQK